MSARIHVPGQATVSATADVTGEAVACGGLRLSSLTGPTASSGSGDPNGTVSGALGSLYVRTDVAELWQNTGGSTGWSKIEAGGGGSTFSGVSAYSNGVQTNASGWVSLIYDQENYDTDSYHSTTVDNTKFFVPSAGYYHITAGVSLYSDFWYPPALCVTTDSVSSGVLRLVQYPTFFNQLSLSVTSYLAAGSHIEVFAYYNINANWSVPGYAPLTIEKVG